MAKTYIKLWDSYRSYFEPLGAAEVGRLVLAMMEYKSSGAVPEFSGSEKFIWPAIRRDLDEDMEFTNRKAEQVKASKSKRKQTNATNGNQGKPVETGCNQGKLNETKSNPIKNKDVGRRTKEVGVNAPDGRTPAPAFDENRFAEPLKTAVTDWLAYKREREENYKPTGLKSLLSEIENKAAAYGADAVAECIQTSMANNWRGIIWDKMIAAKPEKPKSKIVNGVRVYDW